MQQLLKTGDRTGLIITDIDKNSSGEKSGLSIGDVILTVNENTIGSVSDVIKVMEDWWLELKYGSKRDQLSFNYTAWKNSFNFL